MDDSSRILNHTQVNNHLWAPKCVHVHQKQTENGVSLVSGGQILQGHVELFVQRNVPVIQRKITHSPAEEGVNSESGVGHVSLQLSDCLTTQNKQPAVPDYLECIFTGKSKSQQLCVSESFKNNVRTH